VKTCTWTSPLPRKITRARRIYNKTGTIGNRTRSRRCGPRYQVDLIALSPANPHILFRFLPLAVYIAARLVPSMAIPTAQRHYWIFSADPHHYHWDTLFVKGKEMWHGAGSRPDAIRALKQVRKGDRVLCYHSAPERSLYSIAEITRDPYPDPHDRKEKNLVADLRAFDKLPRQITLAEMRAHPALKKVKMLKNVRLVVSSITEAEYQEILRMAGIVATPGIPLP
jgi:predicted RNA-binding protein with PUA-like domain